MADTDAQTGTIVGKIARFDGTPLPGAKVRVVPSVRVARDSDGDRLIFGDVAATTDADGLFTVTTIASDAPGVDPAGITYTITATASGSTVLRVVGVHVPVGGAVSLEDVAPVDPSAPVYAAQVTRAEFDALAALVEAGGGGGTGPAGPPGPKGDPGERGERGLPGERGAPGADGAAGAAGAKGDRGDQGDQGIQGVKGDTGAAGGAGVKGDKGDPGAKGDTGAQGLQGVKGDAGAQGERGLQGDRGATGPGVPAGGTAGQTLRKKSAGDYDTEWAASGGGVAPADLGQRPVLPRPRIGEVVGHMGGNNNQASVPEGTADLFWFPLPPGTYDAVVLRPAAAGSAGALARVGVYAMSSDGTGPAERIAQTAAVDVTAVAVTYAALSTALVVPEQGGGVWAGLASQGGASTRAAWQQLRGESMSIALPWAVRVGNGATSDINYLAAWACRLTGVTGDFPASASNAERNWFNQSAVKILFRRSA